tara:strand:+ start:5830 stop:6351 length:522 start_codon:yes stop_codon:yes gene_type:complete
MDKILTNLESQDLTGEDLKRICKNKVDIIPYHTLGNYKNIEDLLGEFGSVILLYEIRENFGHYVALFMNGNNDLEFFDSYGFKPDQEIKYATYNQSNGIPHLTQLLNKYDKKIVVNTERLQVFHADINTCGRWTSLRILFKKKPLREFIELFTKNRQYNGDFWVSALTYLLTN